VSFDNPANLTVSSELPGLWAGLNKGCDIAAAGLVNICVAVASNLNTRRDIAIAVLCQD